MALAALTLPSVSTGFSSDSKSMVPVSIQGMADKVTKMSPLESMQEVFFDIRDGIDNLATTFSDKISGLNSHLAFRLETLNQTMSNIGNIAEKDLGLEQTQTNIDIENEKEDDINQSLKGGEDEDQGPKQSILDVLKDVFGALSPKNDYAKLGLLGLLTLGIMTQLPKIQKHLTTLFTFLGETLLPALESIFDVVDDETGELKWDRILGIGLGAYIVGKLGTMLLTLPFLVPGGAKVIGYIGLALWAANSVFQKVGDIISAQNWTGDMGATDNMIANMIGGALGGDIKGGIYNAFKNASNMAGTFALVGAGYGLMGGPVGVMAGGLIGGAIGLVLGGILGFIGGGRIAKAIDSSMKAVEDAWDKSGLVGVLDLTFGAFYDSVIAKTFNGVNYIVGAILKKTGLTELGQEIQDYEYSWDGLKQEISDLFDSLAIMLKDTVVNLVNFFLPKSLEIGATDNQQIDTYNSMEAFKQNKPELFEPGGEMFEKYEAQKRIINNIDPSLLKSELVPMNDFERDFGANTNVGDIIDGSYKSNADKTQVIKALEKSSEPPGNITIMTDAKKIDGSTTNSYSNNNYSGTPRVDSYDTTTNALLDYFRR